MDSLRYLFINIFPEISEIITYSELYLIFKIKQNVPDFVYNYWL